MPFRRIVTALGVAGLLVSPAPAWASEPAPGDVAPAPASGVSVAPASTSGVAVAAALSEQDVTFIQAAHQTNLAEITAGRIAWLKTTDPQVKDLAATFMRDHIHLDAALYLTARNLGIRLPSEPNAEQKALTARYEAAGEDTFDDYYITTQLAGHREAVAMLQKQIAEGEDPAIKDLAAKATPVVEGHVQLLRDTAADEGVVGYTGGGGRA